MKAKIIRDIQNLKYHSRIGETVTITRNAMMGKVWVITQDGKEMVWPRKYLEITKDHVEQWVDDIMEAERLGAK